MAYATIITPDLVEPGMHIDAVGGDCPGRTELHADMLRVGRVFVEYEPQTRIEGDIQQLPADSPVVELWRVLRGEMAGGSVRCMLAGIHLAQRPNPACRHGPRAVGSASPSTDPCASSGAPH
ncbi:hypothetical protein GGD40_004938 [Paraburkholderia bryophila]|uniref:Uncharacterized protein n=1 Tax=Paraburkholderia bryophila TaxID=420952 RepID=A0A7Y9WRF6_9BURK|nr:hypothetical protein [Paraburkholderia bryophila]